MAVEQRVLLTLCIIALSSCGDEPEPDSLRAPPRRSSSSGDTGEEPISGAGGSANELCWSTINAHRAKQNLKALARWTEQEACADGEARDDAMTNRAHGSFPRCQEMAQNECPGTPGTPEKALPLCLDAMWREGPGGGHHDAMASTKYTKVACGVFVTSKGSIWSVQNFR